MTLAGIAMAGCETSSHSPSLIDSKPTGGVKDPYIVRDSGQKPAQPAAPSATQPANQGGYP